MTDAALASSVPPPLPGFLNALASPLQHYGLWAIGLLIMLEDFGVPAPGETVLIAGAIYAGAGRLNVVAVGVVGFIAAVIGDNIGFAIGHFGGRAPRGIYRLAHAAAAPCDRRGQYGQRSR